MIDQSNDLLLSSNYRLSETIGVLCLLYKHWKLPVIMEHNYLSIIMMALNKM